ncbi:hotdog fold thioesterase [Nakamurella sp. YIM 132084]|uniref:Hotdog fold thioesterase n=2 Tax=Nakamurella leprariae TaxID=2803911 RepID=A0A938Y6R0_9ACTN|nr:hotdog fold thioesterase [Nakamurella leprariae]
MGIRITDAGLTRVVGRMPVAGNRQPYGLLHGGASAVLAETLGSVHAVLLAPEGHVPVGTELSCTHHRGMRDGEVTGTSTVLHLGRSVATLDITITDGADRRVCTARLSCAFIRPRA